jgi:Peptidase family C78
LFVLFGFLFVCLFICLFVILFVFVAEVSLLFAGHSRTIIGAEIHKTGKYYLLVLDPSIRESTLARALAEQNLTSLKILRLPQEYPTMIEQ